MSFVFSKEITLSPEEYIKAEHRSELRHEYLAGKLYAMAAASETHNCITENIFTGFEVPSQPPLLLTVTEYVPAILATIVRVVSPVDQRYES